MKFHVEHAVWCPACGLFGRRARQRRKAEALAQDAAHIAWAAQLAADTRRERAEAVYRATDGGLFAAMVDNGPDPVPWYVLIGENTIAVLEPEPTPEQRRETWFNLAAGGPW
ncbi:hypothetical protein ADAWI_93 [Mycobacterium phage Adawi]|uniref:Uncharacterized protein n=1 Tax=Mycobacterium phage Adawi TaxID=1354507 RepID=T2A9C1_9CAUD|nr:hypothetical protein ADAWI_93 [Mycobacterium phage Adawi]AGU92004.1 hypothetical protein ADAWI_93 [Mycobacterium phage Adawi]